MGMRMLRPTQKELLNLTLRVQRGNDRKLQRGGSKYRNEPVETVDGRFDSKAEHRHWMLLKQMEKTGRIKDIKRQIMYELAPSVVVGGRKRPPIRYVADFVYFDKEKKQEICADVKGAVTPEYRIKRHLMKSIHGIDILEIAA